MFTNKKSIYVGNEKCLIEAACLKSDTKPTTGVANGSMCLEMDTGKTYAFNEEDSQWEELPSSGGGGGGGGSSDFSTAEVTVIGQGGNISGANIYDDENDDYTASYGVLESGVNTVVLYKGKAILYAQGEISVSGSITDNEGVLTVTGDGTITIS